MSDVLEQICRKKRAHIQMCRQKVTEQELLRRLPDSLPVRDFTQALKKKAKERTIGLIAEIKKASPSKGIIRQDFNPCAIADAYERAGASCLSVLTDTPYFQGQDSYLQDVREKTALPVLRKDFMLEPYQIIESRVLGADCILLIMAALGDAQAGDLEAAATECGMSVLIEVHDEKELERALRLNSTLIGINNRNLKTLDVDIETTRHLAPKVPSGRLVVCESGIATHTDVLHVAETGVYCFLVGESLMRQEDVRLATERLLHG